MACLDGVSGNRHEGARVPTTPHGDGLPALFEKHLAHDDLPHRIVDRTPTHPRSGYLQHPRENQGDNGVGSNRLTHSWHGAAPTCRASPPVPLAPMPTYRAGHDEPWIP